MHSCGFDSIPSDLTVYELHRRAEQDQAGQLGDTNLVVRSFAGGVSGGTVASMLELMRTASTDPEARRLMNDPYTLSPTAPPNPNSADNRTCDGAGAARSRPNSRATGSGRS